MYETWLLVRLVQPKLILDLSRTINRIRHNIGRCQTLRFVTEHDQLVGVRIIFRMCCEGFGLHLAKGIVASGLQRTWVDCIRLWSEVRLLSKSPSAHRLTNATSFNARR